MSLTRLPVEVLLKIMEAIPSGQYGPTLICNLPTPSVQGGIGDSEGRLCYKTIFAFTTISKHFYFLLYPALWASMHFKIWTSRLSGLDSFLLAATASHFFKKRLGRSVTKLTLISNPLGLSSTRTFRQLYEASVGLQWPELPVVASETLLVAQQVIIWLALNAFPLLRMLNVARFDPTIIPLVVQSQLPRLPSKMPYITDFEVEISPLAITSSREYSAFDDFSTWPRMDALRTVKVWTDPGSWFRHNGDHRTTSCLAPVQNLEIIDIALTAVTARVAAALIVSAQPRRLVIKHSDPQLARLLEADLPLTVEALVLGGFDSKRMFQQLLPQKSFQDCRCRSIFIEEDNEPDTLSLSDASMSGLPRSVEHLHRFHDNFRGIKISRLDWTNQSRLDFFFRDEVRMLDRVVHDTVGLLSYISKTVQIHIDSPISTDGTIDSDNPLLGICEVNLCEPTNSSGWHLSSLSKVVTTFEKDWSSLRRNLALLITTQRKTPGQIPIYTRPGSLLLAALGSTRLT